MKALAVILLAAILIFAGCASYTQPPAQRNNSTPPTPSPEKNNSTLANPASVNCVNAGYKDEIRDTKDGQVGYCVFPNGRECEEWAFFRGECTDADSFTMTETPGFVAHAKVVIYKFYADGRLTLTETYPENGSSTMFVAWLAPSDFAAFIKSISGKGYSSLSPDYRTCGGSAGCPSDMPGISLSLLKQGSSQDVFLYGSADHTANLDDIVLSFKKLYGTNTFVNVDLSGCTLMKNGNGELGCFGTVKGITNPVANSPPAGYTPAATDGSLGSCTVDANGGCTYLSPAAMTQLLCSTARGHWNECGTPEACRDPRSMRACPSVCTQYCECGGIAGFGCPTGYFCTEYVPPASIGADGMGLCKPKQ